ncbi:MAG: secretin and TonB N-terminal domain-containing protein, partial [Candidatus Omnitrophica bacterium]|nr:secretin and TonB N-terminal domain-containing protein [Candidatus Omnitrophota bacterium]
FLDSDKTISMDFQEASLKDILKIFSIQSGLNFIASEAVEERKVTLYLDKVPIKDAMDKLFKANNLTYELNEDSNIFIVKDWGKLQPDTITKVFNLKYATVKSSYLQGRSAEVSPASASASAKTGKEEDTGITAVVKKVISEYGSVIEDHRTNSLVVTDIPSRMPIISQVISSLDVAAPQVMLDVEMLDVSKNIVDKLGFDFENSSKTANPFTLILPGGLAKGGAKFYIGAASDRSKEGGVTLSSAYSHVLDYLRVQTDTRTLARPRLLTLNNESAEIKIITSEVIGQTVTFDDQGNMSSITAERTDTGISLIVTPQINVETGEITMYLYPSVKDATTSAFSPAYRDPEERGTKSLVRIKDGDTVIIGGLIRNELQQVLTKLPILGDIPLIGALFRHKGKTKDKQRELLVFITPHIINGPGGYSPEKKFGLGLAGRGQGNILEFNRGLSINTSLNSFEKILK